MKKLFLLILFVQFISVTFAQMSDDQVVAMVKEAQNQGKTQQQIIMMLGVILGEKNNGCQRGARKS